MANMNILDKLKEFVLPKEIDFFGDLEEQSKITEEIIEKLVLKYTVNQKNNIFDLIEKAKKSKKNKIKELEKTFITPVDREAINRSYAHLYWITLSVEHFINELDIYGIHNLNKYDKILELLKEQITNIKIAYSFFNEKQYEQILHIVNQTIHLDNKLVLAYSTQLNLLFDEGKELAVTLKHREILSQLKEISKRIHFCANQIEDIVFKID